jgi:hypothetical protein
LFAYFVSHLSLSLSLSQLNKEWRHRRTKGQSASQRSNMHCVHRRNCLEWQRRFFDYALAAKGAQPFRIASLPLWPCASRGCSREVLSGPAIRRALATWRPRNQFRVGSSNKVRDISVLISLSLSLSLSLYLLSRFASSYHAGIKVKNWKTRWFVQEEELIYYYTHKDVRSSLLVWLLILLFHKR